MTKSSIISTRGRALRQGMQEYRGQAETLKFLGEVIQHEEELKTLAKKGIKDRTFQEAHKRVSAKGDKIKRELRRKLWEQPNKPDRGLRRARSPEIIILSDSEEDDQPSPEQRSNGLIPSRTSARLRAKKAQTSCAAPSNKANNGRKTLPTLSPQELQALFAWKQTTGCRRYDWEEAHRSVPSLHRMTANTCRRAWYSQRNSAEKRGEDWPY